MGLWDTVEKTLRGIDDYILRNGTLDLLIGEDARERMAPFREAKRDRNLDTVLDTQDELMDYFDKLQLKQIDPSKLLEKFKAIIEDHRLKLVFNKYSNHMEKSFIHSDRIGVIFKDSAKMMPPEHILEFAKTLSQSDIMDMAANIDSKKFTLDKSYASDAFSTMARNCPKEDKNDLLYIIDSMPYFKACVTEGRSSAPILVYEELFKDTGTEEALRFLKHSETWKSIPKTQALRDWIHTCDDRLMPAMNYEA
ncbi:MAG: hypothetical protein COB14_09170 [Alphaproteobacteria bacterium]|nr:MAG: hypothetical protein COB14_09170 [Alphaproteobacteria bacterium]